MGFAAAITESMPKKPNEHKRPVGRPKNPQNVGQVVLYVEVPQWLKEAIGQIAADNRRTIKAQIGLILEAAAKSHGYEPPES